MFSNLGPKKNRRIKNGEYNFKAHTRKVLVEQILRIHIPRTRTANNFLLIGMDE